MGSQEMIWEICPISRADPNTTREMGVWAREGCGISQDV